MDKREDVLEFLDRGNQNRITSSHKLSDKSSRSHTVFRIELMVSEKNT